MSQEPIEVQDTNDSVKPESPETELGWIGKLVGTICFLLFGSFFWYIMDEKWTLREQGKLKTLGDVYGYWTVLGIIGGIIIIGIFIAIITTLIKSKKESTHKNINQQH